MAAHPASAPCARALDCGAGTADRERTGDSTPGRGRSASAAVTRTEAQTLLQIEFPPQPERRAGRGGTAGGGIEGRGKGRYAARSAVRAQVRVRCKDSWPRGSRAKGEPDVLILALVTHLLFLISPFPWLLASLNATSRCGILKWHPWNHVPVPPINNCVTPRLNYLTSQSHSFLSCKMGITTVVISTGS